jgi:hypothetical protein
MRFRCAHSKWRSTGSECSGAPSFQTGGGEPFCSPPEYHTWLQAHVQFASRLSARPQAAVNRTYRSDRPSLVDLLQAAVFAQNPRIESVLRDRLRGGDGESADVLRATRHHARLTSSVGDFPEESLGAGRASVRRQTTPEAPGSARGDGASGDRRAQWGPRAETDKPPQTWFAGLRSRDSEGKLRPATSCARVLRLEAEATELNSSA